MGQHFEMRAWRWIRRYDPQGATLKGAIVAGIGLLFALKGLVWMGLAFAVAGSRCSRCRSCCTDETNVAERRR
jgi:hypothetical protein